MDRSIGLLSECFPIRFPDVAVKNIRRTIYLQLRWRAKLLTKKKQNSTIYSKAFFFEGEKEKRNKNVKKKKKKKKTSYIIRETIMEFLNSAVSY